jgi:hypothetical protein
MEMKLKDISKTNLTAPIMYMHVPCKMQDTWQRIRMLL